MWIILLIYWFVKQEKSWEERGVNWVLKTE
jgi:hypothetical protein